MEKDFHSKEIDLDDDRIVKKSKQPRELATMTLAGIYASQGYYAKALSMYEEICENEECSEEATAMIEKLKLMIDRSEDERSDAFGDDILTVSVDDVSRELAKSTSGHGGIGDAIEEVVTPGEEYSEDSGMDEIADQLGKEDEELSGGEPDLPEEEDDRKEPESEEKTASETGKDNKNQFQEWLKKMDEKRGKTE